MGDRVNFVFKDGLDKPVLVLYSHWGRTDRHVTLAAAINHAEPRWSDPSYCARMIISHLLSDDLMSETGFGLYADDGSTAYQEEHVIVDLQAMTVDVEGVQLPFSKYVGLLLEV